MCECGQNTIEDYRDRIEKWADVGVYAYNYLDELIITATEQTVPLDRIRRLRDTLHQMTPSRPGR